MRKKHGMGAAMLLAGMLCMAACGAQEKKPVSEEGVTATQIPDDSDREPKSQEQSDSKTDGSGEKQNEELVIEENAVTFSQESGFYQDEITLEMFCGTEGAVIYYTTDGSVPDSSSLQYKEPLKLKKVFAKDVYSRRTDFCVDSKYVPGKPVTKANVIRAVAVLPDGTVTPVKSGTYFVSLDRKSLYGDAPVISLISDPENLFDYEKGIFVLGKSYDDWLKEDPKNASEPGWKAFGNFANKGRDWERPVSFEYFGEDGTLAYTAQMGLRMKGASTRTYLQKSMKLIAREEYGTKNVKFDLIPDNERSDGTGKVEKYRSFVLRNGGNDCDYTKIRDPLFQQLVAGRGMETQQYTPCVVFLDGEYWGLYTIVEDYSDHYIENNYGIDSKNVVIVKCAEVDEGKEEDFALFEEMYQFITQNDMKAPENYAKAGEMLDLPGFIDYCAMQLYIYNEDSLFDNNNWSLWRVREADGQTAWSDGMWRILLYDTEYSAGLYCGGSNFEKDNITGVLEKSEDREQNLSEYHPGEIFRALYQNEEFANDFILTLCDMRNYYFEKQQAVAAMNEVAADYRKLASDSLLRYGPEWAVMWGKPIDYYEMKLGELNFFLEGRYDAFMNLVRDAMRYENPVSVSVAIPDEGIGKVTINRTVLEENRVADDYYSGLYFKEQAISLTAVPQEGYRFVCWRIQASDSTQENNSELRITLKEDCILTPVFEPIQ